MIPPPPPLWLTLALYWGLTTQESRQCWSAIYRARWSTAAAWRMTLAYFEGQDPTLRSPERVLRFLTVNVMPGTVLSVIEALVQERLLPRWEGTKIEERILAHVGMTGDWAAPEGGRP